MAAPPPLADLAQLNPWWRGSEGFAADPHLRALGMARFQRRPSLLDRLLVEGGAVHTLRGPRQVGKTTLLKQFARQLVAAHRWDPRRVVYYPLDLIDDARRIRDLFEQTKGAYPAGRGERWCFLLDEVSAVPRWQQAVKWLWDHTDARNDLVVVTGSSSIDMRRGGERLPGRRGRGRDLVLLPLSFREFLAATAPDLIPQTPVPLTELLTPAGEAAVRDAALRLSGLQRALDAYAAVGGFPAAVSDHLAGGTVTDRTLADLWNVVAGDLERWGRKRLKALRLLDRLVTSLGAPLSWKSLADDMDVTIPTAEDYANFLADAFLLFVVYFRDLEGNTVPRKEKKLYALDPLILAIPGHVHGVPAPSTAAVMENLVGATLLRAGEKGLIEAFRDPQSLCYWKSSRERELDFLAGYRPRQLPVEVKYKERVGRQQTLGIRNAFGKGVVTSKGDLLWNGAVPVIPTAVFLALVDA